MEGAETLKLTMAATIRELKARQEVQLAEVQKRQSLSAANPGSEEPTAAGRGEKALETLLGLKPFVPKENLSSYMNFISYLGKREEEDVFVRLIQFLAIHTKLGQRLPEEICRAGEQIVRDIRLAIAHDVGSWKEEHESLNRIKHEFQGSISSMLKEHREAHQKHLTFLMDAVIRTVSALEENQRFLSKEFQTITNHPDRNSPYRHSFARRSGRTWLVVYLVMVVSGIVFGGVIWLLVFSVHWSS